MGSRGGRGDFNDIVTQADKQGENRRVDNSINLFRTFIFITEIKWEKSLLEVKDGLGLIIDKEKGL